ncbi:hypothetical protein KP509_12G031400 [Ceratopteris richardii]|uniref:Slow anion channel-associated 1e n=1 Tax=Ceratopteris richardii TaxID=49495 RepID=A0A8T2TK96_CERRI|nr:hypothetical protein KP509_12G031400 [Ceratopteris richardii]KAH7422908.1 hypothetical protein KP509_12G031400 [Ceratopteris richardii]UWV48917.1 slow anion channel-associated 1e [Ceratopteris richardii]
MGYVSNIEVNQGPDGNSHVQEASTLKKLDLSRKEKNVLRSSIEESFMIFSTTTKKPRQEELKASEYFNSYEGVELEILKDPKCSVLPVDKKWPFLLRFPVNCFGINLGLGSQAILWKILATQGHLWFMEVTFLVNLVIWSVATVTYILIFATYTLKIIFYYEAVRQEFNHPVRVNFFFVPWISCIFLIVGAPPLLQTHISPNILWIMFVAPIFTLDLKVFGDWICGGEKRLCNIANPCTHLSLLGNFVGAILLKAVGYTELPLFFWSVGFLHYIILLATLYQRLPSAMTLPKELHPVYFIFFALPSNACVSWAKIKGRFDLAARIIYFFAMFLLLSMVSKAKSFCGFGFNISWWAYTLPLTISAIATTEYSIEVKNSLTQFCATFLTFISSSVVLSLFVVTMLRTFVWKSMFPNDMAISLDINKIKGKRGTYAKKKDFLPCYI